MYSFAVFLCSLYVFYLFQYTYLSNHLLRSFGRFSLSFADKVTTGTYNFVSLIVKIILLELVSSLSLPSVAERMFRPFKLQFDFAINQLSFQVISKSYLE